MNSIAESKRLFYHGFDARVNEVLRGVPAKPEFMCSQERRGYLAACRAEADADTDGYISRQAALAKAARNG